MERHSIETHTMPGERFDDFDSDENVSVSTNRNAVYNKTHRLIDSSGNDVCFGNLV